MGLYYFDNKVNRFDKKRPLFQQDFSASPVMLVTLPTLSINLNLLSSRLGFPYQTVPAQFLSH